MKSHGLKKPYPRSSTGVRYLAPVFVILLCALAGGSLPVVHGDGPAQNVVWVNHVNTDASANTLQKVSGQWDAGANSQQQIGSSGGYVEFGVSMNHRMQVGLSNDTSDAVDYTQLKYTFNFWGDVFDIREGWENNYGWWSYEAGDVFRIEVNGVVVKYYRNGVLLRESTRTPSYPLVLDTALTATGATVQSAVIYTGPPPPSGASAASVKTDFGTYPEPPLPALPEKGQKFNDPTFGTEIMRVTDASDGESNGTWYTFWPSFNCDNTKLLARVNSGQSAVYDFVPQTFTLGDKHLIPQVQPGLNFLGESATWSSSDPDLLYGVVYYDSPQKIVSYNATTHTFSDVYTFTSADLAPGQFLWQMTMSEDDNTFAFTVKDRNLPIQVGYLVWRRPSHSDPGQVILKVNDQTINEVSVDKSGRYLTVPLDNADPVTGDVARIYDLNNLPTAPVVGLKPGPPDFPMGHGDFGHAIAVGWNPENNHYTRRDLANPHSPEDILEVGGYWQSSHLSMTAADDNYANDWSLLSFYDGYESLVGNGRFQREIVLLKNDPAQPNQVRRLLHHRSIYAPAPGPVPDANYWNTPRANISRDREYVAFSSNWGGSNREDLFVARIPGPENDSADDPPAPTNGSLPTPWQRQDIGEVGVAGASGHADGVFTLYGAGTQIWGGGDSLHFVYRELSGDSDIVARVASLDYGTSGASAGVMIRESLSAGSRHAYAGVSRDREVFFNHRPSTDDNSFGQSAGKPLTTFWLKLSRRDNVFTAYRSDNGFVWTQIQEPREINMGANVYAGLVVNSNDSTVLRQAQFDNVCAAAVCTGAPVAPPTNLKYVQTSTGSGFTTNGILSWNDNSDNETGFVIESRPADSVQAGWTQLTVTAANVNTYSISASGPGLAFRVKARAAAGDSIYSDVIVVSGPCDYVQWPDSKRTIQVCYATESCTPPTALIISEFRLRGAAGARDEYVELYNNSDSPVTVCTADTSGGWTLTAGAQGGVSHSYIFTIPNGTVIPARGHFLGVNASPAGGYSLGDEQGGGAAGDVTYTNDIQDDSGIALFMTANPDNFTTANRLDAAGFSGAAPELYREGAGLGAVGTQNGESAFVRMMTGASNNLPQDTGDNAADFMFVATDGAIYNGVQARLGAPGPENIASPVERNSSINVTSLDPTVATSDAPNRVRDFTSNPSNNSTFGTMSLRRRVTNNTGADVTRLRFRVVDLTTYPAATAAADLRPLTSGAIQVTVQGVARTVEGTAVEQPPAQPSGGGFNSTMTVGVVSLAHPLAPGESVDVQFLLGVEKTGTFHFYINVEAAP